MNKQGLEVTSDSPALEDPADVSPLSGHAETAGGWSAPGRSAAWWEKVKLGGFVLKNIVGIMYQTRIMPLLWWYRRNGRSAEAEAVVERIARRWGRSVLAHRHCEVEVTGAEHLLRDGPLLVMCNHQSYYDIPVLMGFLGRPVGFVLKRELYRIPVMAFWMDQIHCLALDRGDSRKAVALFDRWGREMVDNRHCVVIFPEGTRTRDPTGEIGPFRRGSLRLAENFGIPIQPVTIDGTRYLTRPGLLAETRHGGRTVRMRIHPALYPKPMNAPQAKRYVESLRESMVGAWREQRLEWPHPHHKAD